MSPNKSVSAEITDSPSPVQTVIGKSKLACPPQNQRGRHKKHGFTERTSDFAVENLQFLPQYLSIDKFRDDYQYFVNLRVLFEASSQLREFIWNLTLQAADITYTDALEFYASVREAAKRRIDGAVIIWGIRDTPPYTSDELEHHTMASRTPFTLKKPSAARWSMSV
jgi:hypothetical protein